jgi:putative heme-binding domain-containing protein
MHGKRPRCFSWIPILLTCVLRISGGHAGLAQETAKPTRTPRPVAVWPSGPLEVVAAFDMGLDPSRVASLIGRNISYFESGATGRERTAAARPASALRIVGASLTDKKRTLRLYTDPHPRIARYVLALTPPAGDPSPQPPDKGEVSYDLSGVDAAWSPGDDPADHPQWSGWWPLLDFQRAQRLTRGSKRHDECWELLSKPGRLVLGTLVRLPRGTVSLRIEATRPISEVICGDVQAESAPPAPPDQIHFVELAVRSQGDPLFLTITVRTGENARPFSLAAACRVAEEQSRRAIEREQLLLPWAPVPAAAAAPLVVPDLSGGDPVRGQALFNSDQARCSQCHAFRGQGGNIGPDLTAMAQKSRAEIYRNIAAPSAAIDPAYTSYTVVTKDGQVVVGVVRAEGADAIKVTETNARPTLIPRKEIQQIRPSATSIMPVGLAATLGDGAVRDLIAFLTSKRL